MWRSRQIIVQIINFSHFILIFDSKAQILIEM